MEPVNCRHDRTGAVHRAALLHDRCVPAVLSKSGEGLS
jgi:hypothetical protein